MISIFNSTTDYKGFVAVNCEKNSEKDGKGIQQLRFWMRPRKNSQGILKLLDFFRKWASREVRKVRKVLKLKFLRADKVGSWLEVGTPIPACLEA